MDVVSVPALHDAMGITLETVSPLDEPETLATTEATETQISLEESSTTQDSMSQSLISQVSMPESERKEISSAEQQ